MSQSENRVKNTKDNVYKDSSEPNSGFSSELNEIEAKPAPTVSTATVTATSKPKFYSALLKGLNKIVDSQFVLTSKEALSPFECDGLSVYKQLPLLAVLPESTEQVQSILVLCHELKVPVVTRGAGTGLSAGALPNPEGLLLVMSRMNSILKIDAANQLALVQPGVRNLAISEAVHEHGLFYAPDPSSQIACSIGGNVAENAGGVHCLKYGLTVHNILKLKVLTHAGEELIIGADALDSAGFNLLPLLIGSEGMLAVVTEVTVKLVPGPTDVTVLLAAFDSVETAGNAVSEIIAAGVIPGGLELMDKNAINAAEDFVHAGYPRDAAAILLIELDGSKISVSEQRNTVKSVLDKTGLLSLKEARDADERQLFWKGRKNAFPAVGRLAPDYYCMDGTIPRSQLATVLGYINELSDSYGFPVANVFHAGDGNLHPLILFDANIPGQLEQVEEMGGKILEKCIDVGGTITGEHGVGVEKIRQMPLQFSDEELKQFHDVKSALDEEGLLNPGKNIPLLKHCQEYRALSKTLPSTSAKVTKTTPGVEASAKQLQDRLLDAKNEHRLILLDGNHTKAFYGFPLEGEVFSTSKHSGIIHYDPTELVISAKSGTPLADIEAVLDEKGQMLACEPPHFGNASFGGMLGAGLSGPRRPFAGKVSDQVLGTTILNGNGEILHFGGKVMKNVAGYDVSRLMVGSLGCLGLILDATMKVVPKPKAETTYRFNIDPQKMNAFVSQLQSRGLPVSASCHDGEALFLRFSGEENEILNLPKALKKHFSFIEFEEIQELHFWKNIKEHQHPFFEQTRNLWRFSVPADTPVIAIPGNTFYEWNGSLRWLYSDASADEMFSKAAEAGGSACLFKADPFESENITQRFQPLNQTLFTWHKRLKLAFDPDQLFNHGRLYREF